MSISWPTNGEYNVSSYQMSALPFVTSSVISAGEVHRYDFPYVTRFINVVNQGTVETDVIHIGFTQNGISSSVGNYVSIRRHTSVKEEIRTTVLFVSGSTGTNINYDIFCGLTVIPAKNFLPLSASNGHFGVG